MRLAGRGLKKALLLRALLFDSGHLRSRLLQFRARLRNPRLQLAHALRIAALARRGPFQLHSCVAGARLRLQHLAVQLVSALGQCVLARFLLRNLLDRAVDLLRQCRNLRSRRAWSASIAAMRLASTTRSLPRSSSRTAA